MGLENIFMSEVTQTHTHTQKNHTWYALTHKWTLAQNNQNTIHRSHAPQEEGRPKH